MRVQGGHERNETFLLLPRPWSVAVAALLVRLLVAAPIWLFLSLLLFGAGLLEIRPIDWPTAAPERTARAIALGGTAAFAILCAWGVVSLAEQADQPDTRRSRRMRTGILLVGAAAQAALLMLTVAYSQGLDIDHLGMLVSAAGMVMTLVPLLASRSMYYRTVTAAVAGLVTPVVLGFFIFAGWLAVPAVISLCAAALVPRHAGGTPRRALPKAARPTGTLIIIVLALGLGRLMSGCEPVVDQPLMTADPDQYREAVVWPEQCESVWTQEACTHLAVVAHDLSSVPGTRTDNAEISHLPDGRFRLQASAIQPGAVDLPVAQRHLELMLDARRWKNSGSQIGRVRALHHGWDVGYPSVTATITLRTAPEGVRIDAVVETVEPVHIPHY